MYCACMRECVTALHEKGNLLTFVHNILRKHASKLRSNDPIWVGHVRLTRNDSHPFSPLSSSAKETQSTENPLETNPHHNHSRGEPTHQIPIPPRIPKQTHSFSQLPPPTPIRESIIPSYAIHVGLISIPAALLPRLKLVIPAWGGFTVPLHVSSN
jgi:hypothetical protein